MSDLQVASGGLRNLSVRAYRYSLPIQLKGLEASCVEVDIGLCFVQWELRGGG